MRAAPFGLAGLTLALAALPAPAQPFVTGQPYSYSLATVGLAFVDSEAVHKDLNLSPEQVEKLKAHRDAWFAGLTKVRPADLGGKADEMSAANEKALGTILKPDQVARLRQIALHEAVEEVGDRALLYPEVAAAVQLSAEQRAKLNRGAGAEILSKEQRDRWEKLLGPPCASTVHAAFPPEARRIGRRGIPSEPMRLNVLAQKPVQDELKLSKEQLDKVADLEKHWQAFAREASALSVAEQRERRRAVVKETDDAVKALLSAEQFKRLDQIDLQLIIREPTRGGPGGAPQQHRHPLEEGAVVNQLGLDPKQKTALSNVLAERDKALETLFLSDKPPEAIVREVTVLHAQTKEKLDGVLGPDEKKKLTDLLGPPFTGTVSRLRPPFGTRPPALTGPLYLTTPGLSYAQSEDVRKELKLTPEQARKLHDLNEARLAEVLHLRQTLDQDEYARKLAERGREDDKKVAEVLDAGQLKRLRQIVVQQMTRGEGPRVVTARVAECPEIAEPLKLTDEQKGRLRAGDHLPDMLTADQKKTLEGLAGEPFRGEVVPPPLARTPPVEPEVLDLMRTPAVRTDLKMTPEQAAKTNDLYAAWRQASAEARDLAGEAHAKKLREAADAADAGALALLTEGQRQRVKQLRLQQKEDEHGLAGLLATPDVAEALGVTQEQQKKLAVLTEEANKVRALLREHFPPAIAAAPDAEPLPVKFERRARQREEGVLTDQQRAKLKEMLGEPLPAIDAPRGGFAPGLRSVAGFAPPVTRGP
jgi:hypothetical protein